MGDCRHEQELSHSSQIGSVTPSCRKHYVSPATFRLCDRCLGNRTRRSDLESVTQTCRRMLPPHLEPLGFNTWKKEEWDSYRTRLKLPGDPATLQFYRQVVYDHFRHFNEHYPDFRLQ